MANATLALRLRPLVASRALVRELFFTATTPQELLDEGWRQVADRIDTWVRTLPRGR